jgi:predicted ATP-dependent endonuclease of OLD family
MILTKLVVTNFRSIVGTIDVDIDRNTTILLGANDHGKSNILSALTCLNADMPIDEADVNWDSDRNASLEFVAMLSAEESRLLSELIDEQYPKDDSKKISEDDDENESADEEEDTEEPDPIQVHFRELQPLLRKGQTRVRLKRSGVDEPLTFEGLKIDELPDDIQSFLQKSIPRVELFSAFSGELQDSVTADQISTDRFEFLQGIFFYAGLDPLNMEKLFVQNDRSERKLDEASKTLDTELRRLWGQGLDLDLHFELRHRQNSIEFLANDPAVKTRKARMSKRSTGVTQFFRLSMLLHARRKKHPANSYIYLFDEPGVFLHPKGQKDLMQVFEQISTEAQVIYATHSFFMLNQNFPERHRLIIRDAAGTRVDQKPYRANWRLATDALGVSLTANILFSPTVLLVEGDSDPLYIYEIFRQLNRIGSIDADTNMLGILSYGDLPNLRFLLQMFKRDNQTTKVMVLTDGDKSGARINQLIAPLCDRLGVKRAQLGEDKSVEDYVMNETAFLAATVDTLKLAAEAEQQPIPMDLNKQVQQSLAKHKKEGAGNTGRWFKELSKQILGKQGEASKVALARNYVFHCREREQETKVEENHAILPVVREITATLELPRIKATKQVLTAEAP